MALFDFFGSKRKAEAEQKIEEQKQEQHDEAVARQREEHPEMHWPVITPINMFVKKPGETPGAAATAAAEAGANTAAGSENAAAAATLYTPETSDTPHSLPRLSSFAEASVFRTDAESAPT